MEMFQSEKLHTIIDVFIVTLESSKCKLQHAFFFAVRLSGPLQWREMHGCVNADWWRAVAM